MNREKKEVTDINRFQGGWLMINGEMREETNIYQCSCRRFDSQKRFIGNCPLFVFPFLFNFNSTRNRLETLNVRLIGLRGTAAIC